MAKGRAYFQGRLDDNVVSAITDLHRAQATLRRNIRARVAGGGRLTSEEALRSRHSIGMLYALVERAGMLAEDYRNGGKG